MQWSDAQPRTPEQETLLLEKQDAFALAVAPYQLKELHSLRGMLYWLKQSIADELPKCKMSAAGK